MSDLRHLMKCGPCWLYYHIILVYIAAVSYGKEFNASLLSSCCIVVQGTVSVRTGYGVGMKINRIHSSHSSLLNSLHFLLLIKS